MFSVLSIPVFYKNHPTTNKTALLSTCFSIPLLKGFFSTRPLPISQLLPLFMSGLLWVWCPPLAPHPLFGGRCLLSPDGCSWSVMLPALWQCLWVPAVPPVLAYHPYPNSVPHCPLASSVLTASSWDCSLGLGESWGQLWGAKQVQPKHEGLVWQGQGVCLHHCSDWCKLEQPSRYCRASSAQSSSGCIPAKERGRSMRSHWFIFSLIITLLWCPEQPRESNSNSGLLGRGTNIAIGFGKPWISCKGQCYLSLDTSCLAHTARCKYTVWTIT